MVTAKEGHMRDVRLRGVVVGHARREGVRCLVEPEVVGG